MSLEFLSPAGGAADGGEPPIARSPMERGARAAGARFEVRDGFNVAVSYGTSSVDAGAEGDAARRGCGWADVSHRAKLELQGSPSRLSALVGACADGSELELGSATRALDAWWCPLTPTRTLVIGEPTAVAPLRPRLAESASASRVELERSGAVSIVDVTTTLAALTLAGPLAREVFARFSALDLRPSKTPPGALRPGSIARQPAILICEAENRYLFCFGWATAEYVWSVVADAGAHLGGRPIGLDALAELDPVSGDRVTEASNA